MLLKPLALALALTSVYADDVCSKTLTAASQSDLDSISGCSIFNGDIILAAPIDSAVINGVKSVQGSITVQNITTLSSIAAPNLANISDTLRLEILQSLSSASFPALTSVKNLDLITLNKLDKINFAAGVNSIDTLIVSDTTLTTLAGIAPTDLSLLNINNNRYLTSIQFALRSVDELDISSTANALDLQFPYLTTVHNMTIRDAKTVNIYNITSINSTLSFVNTSISTINLPKVKEIGGSLALVSNSQLTNISFPILESIGGGFQIANNSKLASLSGFPALTSVGGAIQFIGDFDSATLPKLDTVRGGVIVDSNSDNFNCSSWNALQQNNGVRGDSYQCKAKSSSTSIAITATSGSHSGSASAATATATDKPSSSKNVAMNYAVESSSLLGAFAVFVLQFI